MNAPALTTMSLRIAEKRRLAEDIVGFELRRSDGGELSEFTAGSHVAVRAPNGLVRKYSLCNDPAERDRYEIAVKRESVAGGAASLIDQANVGDTIAVSEPRNNFGLVKSPAGYLFIAGGIGITPILSMVRQLKREGTRFKLHYCTRSPDLTAFAGEIAAPEFRGQVTIHHDGGDPARALDLWPILERPQGAHLYCCGPQGMMQAVRDMTGHWSASTVHFEAFTEPDRSKPDDRPFKVRLAQTGGTVDVPVGTTILEALRASGLTVPSSCESGTCGTCRTKLLRGEAEHRDLVLSDGERVNNIMVCVSRAKSDEITIDR